MEPPKKKAKATPPNKKATGTKAPKTNSSDEKAQKKANPLGIGEIRSILYEQILCLMPQSAMLQATKLKLTAEGDIVPHELSKTAYQKLDVVQQSGVADIFRLSIAQVSAPFMEFLTEQCGKFVFKFERPRALVNFSEMFSTEALARLPHLKEPLYFCEGSLYQ
ncbi:hypothetical protein LTR86_004886 [Recurvomyces mirabilis]|nr:hypothetical protein LTR86_004886 [Recurvomyces mirabilis]